MCFILKNILDYWYELEFFNPCWPIDFKEDIDLSKSELPWPKIENSPSQRTSFDVYMGKCESEKAIKWMVDELRLPFEEKIEPSNALSCLCAIKIDSAGIYVPNSFAVSSFIWAICNFIHHGMGSHLDRENLLEFQENINNRLFEEDEPVFVDRNKLDNLYQMVCRKIGIVDDQVVHTQWVKRKVQQGSRQSKESQDYIFQDLDPTTELLSSFYLKDIEKVTKNPTERINQYVQAMNKPFGNRIKIDSDVGQMQNWLSAHKYPMGIWPSKYNPCLMQQIGINIAISDEQSIFSVNGPPGTGKTTLLKEIIVSNIVQRAMELSKFDKPDKAFTMKKFANPPDQCNQTYYVPIKSLTKYGILVVSNNNAAVENITVELPKQIKEDRTGYFSDTDKMGTDNYFAEIATDLLNEPAWGLISAKLGNKKNIEKLAQSMWWGKKNRNIKDYYNDPNSIPNWTVAKEKFQIALNGVLDTQKEIADAQHLLNEYSKVKTQEILMNEAYQAVQEQVKECQFALVSTNNTLEQLTRNKIVLEENIRILVKKIPLFKRISWKSFSNNLLIREWKQNELELQNVLIKITREHSLYNEQRQLSEGAKKLHNDILESLESIQKSCNSYRRELFVSQFHFGEHYPDDTFWNNIEGNQESQEISPWTNREYDRLREELFYQALMLHKAFILNSNSVKQNLNRLFSLWKNRFTLEDKKSAYGSLLNTLFFLIPVISTTFASVESFLGDINAEELGLLVVDESGQATPQSALGAIWRTKKAIIVGDPLQVEPIVTIPRELQIQFGKKYNIPPVYRIPELSVQLIGDKLNRYGGVRMLSGQEIWLGCPLVLHRRCINPMFDISNEIAYNNRMFLKTMPPPNTTQLLLCSSYWFDIKGDMHGKGNQNVEEQNDVAIKLFIKCLVDREELPELYIITPFKKIAVKLKTMLLPIIKKTMPNYDDAQIHMWLKEHCGTVHTFQGKEANEVILVLGCDVSIGNGAAKWVGQKPNLINVAVSRAKYRLYVIGDYNQWEKIPYVRVVCEKLKRISKLQIEHLI